MINIHDNEEILERLGISIINVQTVSALCIENDETALAVMNAVVHSMVALQAALGLIPTEQMEPLTNTYLEMLFDYRSATKSGDQAYINEVAEKYDKRMDDAVLSMDVLEG